jgi:hypothetical protein
VLYSVRYRLAAIAAGANLMELRPGANKPVALRRLEVYAETAVAAGAMPGLYRTTNVPAGGTAQQARPKVGAAALPAPAASVISTGWTTVPTLDATALDGGQLGAVVGAAWIKYWPRDEAPVAGYDPALANTLRSLVLKHDGVAAGPALAIFVEFEEV